MEVVLHISDKELRDINYEIIKKKLGKNELNMDRDSLQNRVSAFAKREYPIREAMIQYVKENKDWLLSDIMDVMIEEAYSEDFMSAQEIADRLVSEKRLVNNNRRRRFFRRKG